jgi:hypothetical protein
VKLCIADPPYLGVASTWYGDARAVHLGPSTLHGARTSPPRKADNHPDAHLWDDPESHREMVRTLLDEYDGWAIAMKPASLWHYLPWVPQDKCHIAAWVKNTALPNGSRPIRMWEPVLIRVPDGRRSAQQRDDKTRDWCRTNGPTGAMQGNSFAGAKPREWTRWVLDMLGYNADADTVDDLFAGSGAVANEIAQGVLI